MPWSSRRAWQLRKRSSPPPYRRQQACSAPSRWDFPECVYRCDSQAVFHTCHMPYQRPNRRLKLLSYPDRMTPAHKVRGLATKEKKLCGTKVIMSGVNGNVIMSGCRDDNPDDERREAARD